MDLSQKDIEAGLKELGLVEGDIVLLHSSLSSLGTVEGGADALVDAFLAVLGASGTLLVPIFGKLGIVTDVVKNRPGAVHSVPPSASLAAVGGRAEEICRDHWRAETAHGGGTPYTRIAELGGYVCLMGVDHDRSTTLHSPEAICRMPYLSDREYTFETPEGEVTKTIRHLPGPHRNFIGLDRPLREAGKIRVGRIGSSVVRLTKARDLIDLAVEAGRKDPGFVLCDNPNCADCIAQWAALRRDRFRQEEFTAAASSSLAGRYVPEIVDNCRAAGIDAVELDCLRGRPIHKLRGIKLATAVDALRDEGIAVISLRLRVISSKLAGLVAAASEQRIGRVVLPLTAEAPAHAELVAGKGVTASFYNVNLASEKVLEFMSAAREADARAGLTFNIANFARVAENPFTSLRARLARFIDQLDVEDCTFDGTPTALAMGNAETKEVISAIRCRSFAGAMVLGAGNRHVGDLLATTRRFVDLLENM